MQIYVLIYIGNLYGSIPKQNSNKKNPGDECLCGKVQDWQLKEERGHLTILLFYTEVL